MTCWVVYMWVTENIEDSSSNSFAFDDKLSAKLFMYVRKRNGPIMEPWGTPVLTSAQEEAR